MIRVQRRQSVRHGINCTVVELKHAIGFAGRTIRVVLIVPLWN